METTRHMAHSSVFGQKQVYEQCEILEFIHQTEQMSQNLLLDV
jgi:hypothetical protein